MKLHRLIALALLACTLFLACACTPEANSGDPTTPAETTPPADTTPEDTTEEIPPIRETDIVLSKPDASYRIVYKVGLKDEAQRVFNLLTSLDSSYTAGKYTLTVDTATAADGKPEIVIGDTNRPITQAAKATLKSGLYYAIYVENNSIAITSANVLGITKGVDEFLSKLSSREYSVVYDNAEGNVVKQYSDKDPLDLLYNFAKNKKLPVYTIAVSTPTGIKTKTVNEGNPCQNCYSVTKVYCVTAIGMLYDDGKIKMSDTIGDIFKEELEAYGINPMKWKKVTIDHVLRHRAGYDRGFLDIDAEDSTKYKSQDFLYLALSEPLVHNPGTHYQYTDAAYYLISRVVTKLSGQNLDDFLAERLFKHTDCREYAFAKCPYGYPIGATGLYIRSADVAKLGRIYLDNGKYNNKQIISKEWVDIVLKKGYELGSVGGNGYAKGGMRGQRLYINRAKNVAVAWHSYDPNDKTNSLKEYLYNTVF
ncbi:MAG: serine hydrolase [Clostridia bacterium]|nr:serine hydrolase [Clostridia bacterium]